MVGVRNAVLLVLCCVSPLPAAGQQYTLDLGGTGRRASSALMPADTAPAPPGLIEGTVFEEGTGKPLARSAVTIEAVNAGMALPQGSMLSDSSGRFAFQGLAPGAYRIRAQRQGFLPGYFGGRSPSPIVVTPGSRFTAAVPLQRGAAISGEVLDENQVGLAGVVVEAFPAGRIPLQLVSTAVSDERGVFRLAGLAPGRYWVRTAARELEDRQGILPTFLGQTTRAASARFVNVEAGTETPAGAIQPIFGRLGRLEGRVTGGTAVSVMLFTDAGKREVAPDPAGRFAFEQLAPGEYELIVNTANALVGWRRVQVGEGTSGTVVQLGHMPVITVRSQPEARALVQLRRLGDSFAFPSAAVEPGAPRQVYPGAYSVQAFAPAGMYVAAVEPKELVLLPGEAADVSVVLSSRPARLSGHLTMPGGLAAAATPVWLFAADPDVARRMGGVRRTFTNDTGAFEFADLPPGTFTVVPAPELPEGSEPDAQPVSGRAVTLEEGAAVSMDVELRPLPR